MFVRIVKLSFQPEKTEMFLSVFDENKENIRNSPGCRLLELYRDKTDPNIIFSYSYWEKEEDLNNYRNSFFFKGLWSQMKTMFNDKPLAWSLDKVASLT